MNGMIPETPEELAELRRLQSTPYNPTRFTYDKFFAEVFPNQFKISKTMNTIIYQDTFDLTHELLEVYLKEQRIFWVETTPYILAGIERMERTPHFGLLLKPYKRFVSVSDNKPGLRLLTAKEGIELTFQERMFQESKRIDNQLKRTRKG